LLWIGPGPVSAGVFPALTDWRISILDPNQPLERQLRRTGVALVCPSVASGDLRLLGKLIDVLEHSSAVAVILIPPGQTQTWSMLSNRVGQYIALSQDAPYGELQMALRAAGTFQHVIQNLQEELATSQQRYSRPATEGFDEQMRMAARLQHDFLPRRLPEVGPVRFGALYRPADWVSGDLYDVVRLDEMNVGFYVADAVGHGLAAALLTIFIKKAIQAKRISGNEYEIIPPNVSLELLNRDICEQSLSSCQFCTAVYCVIDCSTMRLLYSRGGHPEPLLLRGDGSVVSLGGEGGLLGIIPEQTYELLELQLRPGDRLVVFSDGAQEALSRWPDGKVKDIAQVMRHWIGVPRDQVLLEINQRIEQAPTEVCGLDDATVLVVDIGG